jgi:Cof subfamily protein (haloacid dehalogenase superfamily)
LFVFDLDGTLLNEKHQISEVTLHTLHELRSRGIELVIATGRHIEDIRHYLHQLGGDISAITCNGANIHDKKGEHIYRQYIDKKNIATFLELSKPFPVHVSIYTDKEWLVCSPYEKLLESHVHSQFCYRQAEHEEFLGANVLKIIFYGEHVVLQSFQQEIANKHFKKINVVFSDRHRLEVTHEFASKGKALQNLLRELRLSGKNIMAFGDGLNDAELLSSVSHPVIMENSDPSLKKLFPNASIAQKNCNDGVAIFLRDNVTSI